MKETGKMKVTLFIFFTLAFFITILGCGELVNTAGDIGTGPGSAVLPTGPGSVTLSWVEPTQDEFDNPLADLAGYRVYYGDRSRAYTEIRTYFSPLVTVDYSIENLPLGRTLYFSVTAFDVSGNESIFSNEASIILHAVD